MKSLSFRKDLIGVQEELLRFAYKLTANREEANDLLQETSLKALDNEEKYVPDTNFKGWMYTIMRNIFINNYRKIVRDQTFVDTTDNYYHLNLPQDSGFESTEGAYDLKEMHRIVNALPREYKIPFSMQDVYKRQVYHFAHILHTRSYSAQSIERRFQFVGNDLCKSCFTYSGRSPENKRRDASCVNHLPQDGSRSN